MNRSSHIIRLWDPASRDCFALVDSDGNLLCEPQFEDIGAFEADGRGGFIACTKARGGDWGYIDQRGRWLHPPTLRKAYRLSPDGLARFQQNGYWGYVDATGKVVIEPRFEEALSCKSGRASVRVKGGFGYIDRQGTLIIPGPLAQADGFSSCGLAAARPEGGKLFGYLDPQGRWAIEPRFQNALAFSPSGAAPVAEREKAWGLLDIRGAWITKPVYASISAFNDDELALFEKKNRKGYGYLNAKGGIALDKVPFWQDRMAYGRLPSDHFGEEPVGFRDTTGALVIPSLYEWASPFHACGASVARRGGIWGVLQRDGAFFPYPGAEPCSRECGLDGIRILGFGEGAGICPFITEAREIHYLDAGGKRVCGLSKDLDGLKLFNSVGERVWKGSVNEDFRFQERVFQAGIAEHFLELENPEGVIIDVARSLINEEPRSFYPESMVFGLRDGDVYDLEGLDEDEFDSVRQGAMQVLASTYAGEEAWGEYLFLYAHAQQAFEGYFDSLTRALSAEFGPTANQKLEPLRSGDSNRQSIWPVGDRWMSLELFQCTGDGNFEFQLWLAVVES